MRRRDFLAGLLLTATMPHAQAQQAGKVYRIAVVHPSNPVTEMNEAGAHPYYRAFFSELRRLGYVEGHNLVVERRSGESRTERYPELAREVVALKPDLIFTAGPYLSRNLKAATSSIPIVTLVGDPVVLGLADGLARPGGNVTGVNSDTGVETHQKYVKLLNDGSL